MEEQASLQNSTALKQWKVFKLLLVAEEQMQVQVLLRVSKLMTWKKSLKDMQNPVPQWNPEQDFPWFFKGMMTTQTS